MIISIGEDVARRGGSALLLLLLLATFAADGMGSGGKGGNFGARLAPWSALRADGDGGGRGIGEARGIGRPLMPRNVLRLRGGAEDDSGVDADDYLMITEDEEGGSQGVSSSLPAQATE